MAESDVRVRVNFSAREIEVCGSQQAVDAYLDRFAELMDQFSNRDIPSPAVAAPAGVTKALPLGAMPSEFGEYLQRFSKAETDVDRVLIAGHFVQTSSATTSFTTREVNQLLLAQGVRLSNPSESIRQNVRSRKMFPLSGGEFRVSQSGLEHLTSLN